MTKDLPRPRAPRPRHPQRPPGAQAGGQLALQRPPALDVERLVDRLMADPHRRVIRVVQPQALGDLLRAPRHSPSTVLPRPVPASLPGHGWPGNRGPARGGDMARQPLLHVGPQHRVRRELRRLRATGRPLRVPLGRGRPVLEAATPRRRIAPQLPRDRGRRPPEPAGHLAHAVTLRPQQGDLLPFREGQVAPGERLRRPRQVRRRHPARLPEPAEPDRLRDPHLHRRVLARQTCRDERPEPPPILTPRYPRPPRRPQLTPQGPIRTPPTRHRNRPPASCCDDQLRPRRGPPYPGACTACDCPLRATTNQPSALSSGTASRIFKPRPRCA